MKAGMGTGEDNTGHQASGGAEPAHCEVMFYHLTRMPLEQALPLLLHKTLAREKRALVRCGNALRLRVLSDAIWTWRDEAFIAHGLPEEGHMHLQPVLLLPDENSDSPAPNGAQYLFCVEGARPRGEDFAHFERICVLFADADETLKERARELWRELKKREDVRLTYWQQDARGNWERKA